MVSQPGGFMKKSKFTETQIVSILKQADAGVPVKDVCRQAGISTPPTVTLEIERALYCRCRLRGSRPRPDKGKAGVQIAGRAQVRPVLLIEFHDFECLSVRRREQTVHDEAAVGSLHIGH